MNNNQHDEFVQVTVIGTLGFFGAIIGAGLIGIVWQSVQWVCNLL